MRARIAVLAVLALLAAAAGMLLVRVADDGPAASAPSGDAGTPPELDEEGAYRPGSIEGVDGGSGEGAVEAAIEVVPLALAYDYRRLDRTLVAATSRMTEAFAAEFTTTFNASVRPLARSKQAVSEARVRAAGLVEADGDSATVLVFVDQVLVSSRAMQESDQPVRVGQTRVRVVLVKVGDAWKVDDLGPL